MSIAYMTQSSGRKETTNDPRGTQSRHRTVRPPGDAGGRATRSRGRTPDQGWLAASPQCALRVGADRAGAGRSAHARGRAHPRARGRGSLSGILVRGVADRTPKLRGTFLLT